MIFNDNFEVDQKFFWGRAQLDFFLKSNNFFEGKKQLDRGYKKIKLGNDFSSFEIQISNFSNYKFDSQEG